jgi:hypothetical protein
VPDDEDTWTRICTRVADMVGPPDPTAVEDRCARCGAVVYFTVGQDLPADRAAAEPVCTRCLVADPDLTAACDPALLRMAHESHLAADWLGRLGGPGPAR